MKKFLYLLCLCLIAAGAAAEDLLRNAPWRFVTADNGSGNVEKLAGGGRTVSSTAGKGYVSFANSRGLPILPGESYTVTAKITRKDPAVNARMLVSIGKRTPWATVKTDDSSTEPQTITYRFTAKENETGMRVHFIVSGQGSIEISQVELTAEGKVKTKSDKISITDFSGKNLAEYFKPVNMLKKLPGTMCFESRPFGGIECRNLNWDAARIKSVDVRLAADEPGYIYLEFATAAGQKSYLSQAAYPGFPMKDYTFNVSSNPAWRGRITSIRFIWRAYERNCRLEFGRILAKNNTNIIPFADEKSSQKEFTLISLLPRAEYSLQYTGKNPGMTLEFFDRHGKRLDTYTLKKGSEKGSFATPDMTVRTRLTLNDPGKGYPQIQMLNWSKPDRKPYDWRGKWIWSNTEFGPANEHVWFRRDFEVSGNIQEAEAIFTADDSFTVFINGQKAFTGNNWRTPVRASVTKYLKPGKNSIVIQTWNETAWGGMIGELYVKAGNRNYFFPTDNSWQYRIGGTSAPEKYTANALELGTPPTSPWGDLPFLYVGPKGKVSVEKAGDLTARIKVSESVPVKIGKLDFRLKYPDGKERIVTGGIVPDTSKWQAGKTIDVKINLPQINASGVRAELASDFIDSTGTFCLLPDGGKSKPHMATARIENTGKRSYFVIDGKKYPPIYYDGYGKIQNSWMLEKAQQGGCRIVRINCDIHRIWKSENEFDFSIIDNYMDVFAVNAPEVKIILQVKMTMPDWWLAKYPGDVVAYHDGRPYSPAHDRQALASARWRKDGAYALRQLMKYLKKSPNTGRIFAIGLSEGWNSEWFWSTLGGAASGYSAADLDTFKTYLKESYSGDEALAKAWNMPGLTFDTVKMPMPKEIDHGASCGELADPAKDRRIMDYFRFRNRALGDAVETFAKVVKEESGNRYLVGIYYGYFVMFSHVNRKLQTVGHLEIERLARSPYVDMFWAPSLYHWRQIGMPDGVMQAADALSAYGKLTVVEQDMRTFSEPSHMQAGNGRTNNPDQTINAMHRALGMLLARGIGMHWYDMHEIWFREKVLLETMKDINDTYMALPDVKNTTPTEVCLVSDVESAYYTRHNFNRHPNKGSVYEFLRTFNYAGIPFRHVFVNDLLDKDRIPAHKLYILTSPVMMTPEKYQQLMSRFRKEKAAVLHLYATGVTRPEQGPSAENMGNLLGMKFVMDKRNALPVCRPAKGNKFKAFANPVASSPWFYPVSGFDQVMGVAANGQPVLVKKADNGVTVYFSTLMKPGLEIIRQIARESGVHIYSDDTRNALHIGNDCLFILPSYDGKTVINLPEGRKLYGMIGEYKGKEFASGESIEIRNGTCAAFLVR